MTHQIGEFVTVRFGVGKQLARVEGFTKDGRHKVRGYNASREVWMPNLRIVPHDDMLGSYLGPLPDLRKAFRVYENNEDGTPAYEMRDGRRWFKHTWVPLPPVGA